MLKPPKPSKVEIRKADEFTKNPVGAIQLVVLLFKSRFPFEFLKTGLVRFCWNSLLFAF